MLGEVESQTSTRVNTPTTSNWLTFQAPVATWSAWRNRKRPLSNPYRTLVPSFPLTAESTWRT